MAPAVGYTNQLLPLLAILLAGATLLGAIVVRYGPPPEPSPIADRTEAAYWHWHVLAAAALCVAVVTLVPTWSQPNNYFGARVVMMDAGERPYVDFEYAYGALIAYLPYALHAAGLSVQKAVARKTDELRRAMFYVIPAQRERATAAAGAPINRALRDFGRVGLYPFRLAAAGQARRIDAPFVDLLYDGCRPLASADGIRVCVFTKDLPPPH